MGPDRECDLFTAGGTLGEVGVFGVIGSTLGEVGVFGVVDSTLGKVVAFGAVGSTLGEVGVFGVVGCSTGVVGGGCVIRPGDFWNKPDPGWYGPSLGSFVFFPPWPSDVSILQLEKAGCPPIDCTLRVKNDESAAGVPVKCGKPRDANFVPFERSLCTCDCVLSGSDMFLVLVRQTLEEPSEAVYFDERIIGLSEPKLRFHSGKSRETP